MKKISLAILVVLAAMSSSVAQGTLGNGGKQLNAGFGFSNWGVPIYVGLDFGVHESITIGPKVSYRNYSSGTYSQNLFVISFNGNYHFNQLLELPEALDLYAGLSLGYYLWSDNSDFTGANASGVGLSGQIGVRYFFSEKFGLNLEFGGGNGTGGDFGITYKL